MGGQYKVRYSGHGLNSKPFDNRTNPHDLNTKLVSYSDPYCILKNIAEPIPILRGTLGFPVTLVVKHCSKLKSTKIDRHFMLQIRAQMARVLPVDVADAHSRQSRRQTRHIPPQPPRADWPFTAHDPAAIVNGRTRS